MDFSNTLAPVELTFLFHFLWYTSVDTEVYGIYAYLVNLLQGGPTQIPPRLPIFLYPPPKKKPQDIYSLNKNSKKYISLLK